MKKLIFLILFPLVITSCQQADRWTIESPSGKVTLTVALDESGQLNYRAFLHTGDTQAAALESSPLGIIRQDGNFAEGLSFESVTGPVTISDSYTLTSGKQKDISFEVTETALLFSNRDGEKMNLVVRVFDDGIAYRYHFPGETADTLQITQEYSGFNLPDEGRVWIHPYDTVTRYRPGYETFYENGIAIGTKAPEGKNGWAFPATFQCNDLWVLISEANLDGRYPASHLQPECSEGVYTLRFPEPEECFGQFQRLPHSSLPWSTPWRVAIIGDSPGTIIESNIITHLAEPSVIEDTGWIDPGRAAWSWWSDSPSPRLVSEQNRFTDLAVTMGWEYNLIDANWDQMTDGTVQNAIDYANDKGIGCLLWYNSGGPHNEVPEEPRDRMWDPEIRQKEMAMLEARGVKGIKVDFFQSDKQKVINQYIGIMEDAARHHLLVNFHGCTVPRGWRRTYPNLMTMEAVKGAEVYKFGSDFPGRAPDLNTIYPFTRNAIGPMDYTPVTFSDHNHPHLTTYAHEMALSVIFESGIQHMADKVEAYLGQPDYVQELLSRVPASWDETRYLGGLPGKEIMLARRNGDTWYLAGINGEDRAKTLSVPTDFLPENSRSITVIADGENDETFRKQTIDHTDSETFDIDLLPYGGFVAFVK